LRVAASVHFSKSERLRQFLLYVCEHAIRGTVEEINESNIGCRVFGRAPGFNRSEDSIVRVEARNLRKRLEAYFASEGIDEPIVITIPKGSYVPAFEARLAPPTSPPAPPVAPSPPAPPAPPTRSFRDFLSPARMGALLALSVAVNLLFLAFGGRILPQTPVHDSALWSTLLSPQLHTQIVVGDTCTLASQQALGRSFTLEEYLRVRSVRRVAEDRSRLPMTFAGLCEHTSFGDVNVVARLLETNRNYGGLVAVKYARDLQIRDFKQDSFIILGGPRSNPWVQLFEPKLNFVRGFGPEPPLPHFRNRMRRDGEQEFYQSMSADGLSGQDYGTVAYLPNLGGNGRVLIITGASMFGMEAAAEFITSRDFTSILRKVLNVPTGELPSFELLFKTTRIAGTTKSTEIVAHRSFPHGL
jgi:hypothetical protein